MIEWLQQKSRNGFHVFLDKQKAFHEIWRVLKPGGDFIACFLYQGKIETDRLVVQIFLHRK